MSNTNAARRAWIDVDLPALIDNARTIVRVSGGARLLPMVKANAYGVGVGPVVRALETLDPWGYGVATADEGAELRESGITRPIIVFTPSLPDHFAVLRAHALRPVLDDPVAIRQWDGPFHLEIDTGMGRAGIPWHETDSIDRALACGPEGIFTHFHSADVPGHSVSTQVQRFEDVRRRVGPGAVLAHVANSAGAFHEIAPYDLVRPGIFLYGGGAGPHTSAPAPVVTVSTRVMSLRMVRPGDTVSYGATWEAQSDTVVATLGIGYADGVRRSMAGEASVLIAGRRFPIVGRVTMDMTMVALGSDRSGIEVGDEAVLIGASRDERISLDEAAAWAGTISYEILTGLGRRVPRYYQENSA